MSRHVPRKSPKVRATLYLPYDLFEEARDATVHLAGFPVRLTLTKFAENAFRAELDQLKLRYNAGCEFPPAKTTSKADVRSQPSVRILETPGAPT